MWRYGMGSRLSATTLPMLPTRLQERDADRLYAMRDLVMPKSGPKVMAAMTARTKVGFSHNCMASLSMSILHSRSCRGAAGNYRKPRIERTSAVRGLSRPCRSVDLRSEADKLIELICELFPICRSITGDDHAKASSGLAQSAIWHRQTQCASFRNSRRYSC